MPTSGRKLGESRAISTIGPPAHVRDAGADRRLEAEQLDAVDAAERLARVVDPGRAQVGRAVAVDVDAGLEHVDELIEVEHGLAQPVAVRDDRAAGGVDAFGRIDRAVAVLVEAAAAGGERLRRPAGLRHGVGAGRAEAVTDDVDRDRRDPACASDEATAHGAPFIESVKPWPKTATGQPPAGAAPDGTKSVNTSGYALHRRDAGARPDRGDDLGAFS